MPDPSPRMPSYSHVENWRPDEDEQPSFRPSSEDTLLRAASVAPFILIAAFGVIALVGWVIVIAFGVAAPGNPHAQPIWRWAQGQTAAQVITQLLLVVAIGLIPVAVILVASWATIHGFRLRPHPLFWPAAELLWGVVAVALVVVDRTRHQFLDEMGVGTLDWWFLFLLVAAAIILAAARVRRLRAKPGG